MGASLLALAKSIYQGLFMVCLVINGKRGKHKHKHNNIKIWRLWNGDSRILDAYDETEQKHCSCIKQCAGSKRTNYNCGLCCTPITSKHKAIYSPKAN